MLRPVDSLPPERTVRPRRLDTTTALEVGDHRGALVHDHDLARARAPDVATLTAVLVTRLVAEVATETTHLTVVLDGVSVRRELRPLVAARESAIRRALAGPRSAAEVGPERARESAARRERLGRARAVLVPHPEPRTLREGRWEGVYTQADAPHRQGRAQHRRNPCARAGAHSRQPSPSRAGMTTSTTVVASSVTPSPMSVTRKR
jgi:hypothetical protein